MIRYRVEEVGGGQSVPMDTQRWRRGRSQPLGLCAMIHHGHVTRRHRIRLTCWQANLPTFELTAFLGRFAKGQRKQSTWDPLWPSRTMAGQVAGKQAVGCLL